MKLWLLFPCEECHIITFGLSLTLTQVTEDYSLGCLRSLVHLSFIRQTNQTDFETSILSYYQSFVDSSTVNTIFASQQLVPYFWQRRIGILGASHDTYKASWQWDVHFCAKLPMPI